MFSSLHPVVLLGIVAVAVALVTAAIAIYVRVPLKLTRTGVGVSMLPSLLMLVLFYSLAIHMHESLGAWPTSIGERDFSGSLTLHAHLAVGYFGVLLLVTILIWPVALVLCTLIRRW